MQDAIGRYAEELRRKQGLDVQIRVGLNSGRSWAASIAATSMDYTAVGQTTQLAGRMEQLARPGTTDDHHRKHACLAEGFVQVPSLGPVPLKGLADPSRSTSSSGAPPALPPARAAAAHGHTRFSGAPSRSSSSSARWSEPVMAMATAVASSGSPGWGNPASSMVHSFPPAQGWFVLRPSPSRTGRRPRICRSSTLEDVLPDRGRRAESRDDTGQ